MSAVEVLGKVDNASSTSKASCAADDATLIVKTEDALDDVSFKKRYSANKNPSDGGCPPNNKPNLRSFGMGTFQQRAEAMLEEAGKATGVNYKDFVDQVIFDSAEKTPHFWVTNKGVRQIFIDPSTMNESFEMQLLIATHELEHAIHFDNVLKYVFNWDLKRARDAFFVNQRTHRSAIREVLTESVALDRVKRYLGGLSDETWCNSLDYIMDYSKKGKIE